jgi:hypothetical protein
MDLLPQSIGLGAATFVGLLIALSAGHRVGRRRLARASGASRDAASTAGQAPIESAVFAILGLLLAFTFSGAAGRFADRRDLVTQEANTMGTAWLRIDLLPVSAQPAIRTALRRYVDARLAVYRTPGDDAAVAAGVRATGEAQATLWGLVVEAVATPEGQRAVTTVVPAMNDMFDLATTRTMAMEVHQPPLLYGFLLLLMFVAAFVAGISMAPRERISRIYAGVFAATLATTIWITVDLEYPRRGVLRITSQDRAITTLRAEMDRTP